MTMRKQWHNPRFSTAAGAFLLFYFLTILGGRYTIRGSNALYDAFWACNVAVLLCGLGAIFRSSSIIGTAVVVSVAVHLLWCLDVIGWFLLGKFYVGSAAFLAWPQTTWITIATTLHHVWFQPLALYLLRGNGGLKPVTFWYSWILYYFMMTAGRMIPKSVVLGDGKPFMLNINQGHGAYESVKLEWLHMFNDSHPLIYFTWATILGCGVVTTPLFFALRTFSRKYLEGELSSEPTKTRQSPTRRGVKKE